MGLTMFILTQLAWNVSGAHFNPAVSFAVFATEGYSRGSGRPLAVCWLGQLLGAYMGVLIFYLGIQQGYKSGTNYSPFQHVILPVLPFYDDPEGTPHFLKVIIYTSFLSFLFVLFFLGQKYNASANTQDDLLKAATIGAAYSLVTCLGTITGMCINPFLQLAQTTIAIAVQNQYSIDSHPGTGNPPEFSEFARYLWVYFIFPFVGAAAAVYLHRGWHKANCDGV